VPDQIARNAGLLKSFAGQRLGLAALLVLFGSQPLESVVANGDTRTISLHHLHTGEDLTITYKRDGKFDEAALEKLNHILRDWRVEQTIKMDPHLIDLVWEVNREVGSKQPIQIVCGYRSPSTNAMLRAHSRGVAQFSQHMLGKAMDFYIPGVELSQLRDVGLRLQRGGVGFYPTSGWPFVHLDTGNVRHWPRVPRDYLVRLFPNGKTVHIPADGRPLPGFQLALAEIHARGQEVVPATAFASRGDEEADTGATAAPTRDPLTKFLTSIFKPHGDEERATEYASLAPTQNAEPAARPVAVASVKPAPPNAARLQWTKGPDSASKTAEPAPLPRARPTETRTALAALPAERKVASAGDVTASLPLAITGGDNPTTALGYAASDPFPRRTIAPAVETVANAAIARLQPQEAAPAQDAIASPGLYGDAAHSPTHLFEKTPLQYTAELRHPDQESLVILLDPSAAKAGYFAHQSGGKLAAGTLSSAY